MKMSPLLVLLCCASVLVASLPQRSTVYYDIAEAERHFSDFINAFDKQYAHDEERDRKFEVFKKNLKIINKKNQESDSAIFGINHFSDLTTEEFLQRHTGFNSTGSSNCQARTLSKGLGTSVGDSLDWRALGKVTPVRNQGVCSSCWAFSSIGNVEGQYAIKHSQLLELSEQELVDCVRKSCQPYLISAAIETLRVNGMGLMSRFDYPYTGVPGTCNYNEAQAKVKITGCHVYNVQSEEELKQLVATVGPIAVAIASADIKDYHGEILADCTGQVNHAVLLVGYGEEGGRPYWLIKNSWGEKWGDNGYLRLLRGINACNILSGEQVNAEIA